MKEPYHVFFLLIIIALIVAAVLLGPACAWRSPRITYHQTVQFSGTNAVPTNALMVVNDNLIEFRYEGSKQDLHYK